MLKPRLWCHLEERVVCQLWQPDILFVDSCQSRWLPIRKRWAWVDEDRLKLKHHHNMSKSTTTKLLTMIIVVIIVVCIITLYKLTAFQIIIISMIIIIVQQINIFLSHHQVIHEKQADIILWATGSQGRSERTGVMWLKRYSWRTILKRVHFEQAVDESSLKNRRAILKRVTIVKSEETLL